MPVFGFFTKAIEKAWSYVEKAVETGLSSIEGFTQYISGGGDIEQDEFAGAYVTRTQAKETWEGIKAIPSTYRVSGEFAVISPFDWARKHVMKMKVEFTSLSTGETSQQWITVESDTQLSLQEWESEARNVVMEGPITEDYIIESILDYQYYLRER